MHSDIIRGAVNPAGVVGGSTSWWEYQSGRRFQDAVARVRKGRWVRFLVCMSPVAIIYK